jgi:deoxyribodipyrimidine photolyase-related protein
MVYTLMEVRQETDYTLHHVQKIIAFFAAMRAFASMLRSRGHKVVYIRLDDPANLQSIGGNIERLIKERGFGRFEYMLPDEYRLDLELQNLAQSLPVETGSFDSEHFLTRRSDLADYFKGRKSYRMESFYRHMRRSLDVLMDGDRPVSGRWNYDTENRRALDPSVKVPRAIEFKHDVTCLVRMIERHGVATMGSLDPRHFPWPRDREEALLMLNAFLRRCLARFGTYQDAMSSRHQTLFHSRLSFALNTKMLGPMEVIDLTLRHWKAKRREIDIAQVEGFVRQIIGWREFMRGVYWAEMPRYRKLNYFGHRAHLPHYYWSGETRMRCMRQAIGQSLSGAYAHHIQRLMVTGNFALLAGVDPDEVDDWYLGVYIDALEWVETTNTRGMSQFADGGLVATKPYVSTANYIHRMSDYCDGCFYDRARRHGNRACPFNSLYWHFLDRHRRLLIRNPRTGMMYRNLDKMKKSEREATLAQARAYSKRLNDL